MAHLRPERSRHLLHVLHVRGRLRIPNAHRTGGAAVTFGPGLSPWGMNRLRGAGRGRLPSGCCGRTGLRGDSPGDRRSNHESTRPRLALDHSPVVDRAARRTQRLHVRRHPGAVQCQPTGVGLLSPGTSRPTTRRSVRPTLRLVRTVSVAARPGSARLGVTLPAHVSSRNRRTTSTVLSARTTTRSNSSSTIALRVATGSPGHCARRARTFAGPVGAGCPSGAPGPAKPGRPRPSRGGSAGPRPAPRPRRL